jgi:hypothetical protein
MREVELALRCVGRIEWRASDLLLVRVTHDDDASSAMSHTLALVSFVSMNVKVVSKEYRKNKERKRDAMIVMQVVMQD